MSAYTLDTSGSACWLSLMLLRLYLTCLSEGWWAAIDKPILCFVYHNDSWYLYSGFENNQNKSCLWPYCIMWNFDVPQEKLLDFFIPSKLVIFFLNFYLSIELFTVSQPLSLTSNLMLNKRVIAFTQLLSLPQQT